MPLTPTDRCYALLKTHTDVWALYERCKQAGLDVRIAPTPRSAEAHASCGTSLLVPCDTQTHVMKAAADGKIETNGIVKVENAINPKRDHYC